MAEKLGLDLEAAKGDGPLSAASRNAHPTSSISPLRGDQTASLGGISIANLAAPSAYSGLYAFHKYWGKKPVEPLRALVSALSDHGDIIADPFLGSGALASETVQLGRRFLGSDINPVALKLADFNLNPCSSKEYSEALGVLSDRIKSDIVASYEVQGSGETSHLLWCDGAIESVWQRPILGTRRRYERLPNEADYKLAAKYEGYNPELLRPLKVFHNSRINATVDLGWSTLFTGRALRNIELILAEIRALPATIRPAMELTLTASIGQMSRMVFAITSRGKASGSTASRVEVGSWVIGFWRPKQHFEINVWNCFEGRAKKLLKALPASPKPVRTAASAAEVMTGHGAAYLAPAGAASLLAEVPPDTLQLCITDPPHGDRMPYLELSEIWNAVLGEDPNLDEEIVVSNAKSRCKTIDDYNTRLASVLQAVARKTRLGGFVVLLFNSRHQREWKALQALAEANGINLLGSMPLHYSARSVVQDNRDGSMKTDYIVVYSKGTPRGERVRALELVPGWNSALPTEA